MRQLSLVLAAVIAMFALIGSAQEAGPYKVLKRASSPWQKSVVLDDEAGTRHRNSVEMLGAIAVG